MIQSYTYAGITSANHNQDGFFHVLQSSNCLINIIVSLTGGAAAALPVFASPDGENFYFLQTVTLASQQANAASYAQQGLAGIKGVMIVPGAAQTYTLTVTEYNMPTQTLQIGAS